MKYPLDEFLKDYSYMSMGVAIGGWHQVSLDWGTFFACLGVILYISSIVAYCFKRREDEPEEG